MKVLRIQNKVPSAYTEESRDFQLLCRLYDCVFNGVLYDSKAISNISDTKSIKENLIPLLQTKLGFFTDDTFMLSNLRYALRGFPLMVKNKGSRTGISYAVNNFLKMNNIFSPAVVTYQKESTVLSNGVTVPAHTVVIGISSSLQDSRLLEEEFRYILPIGISTYFYYYSKINKLTELLENDKTEIIYISNNINSKLRAYSDYYTTDENTTPWEYAKEGKFRLVNALDTVNFIDLNNAETDEDLLAKVGGNGSETQYKFLGVFYDENIEDFGLYWNEHSNEILGDETLDEGFIIVYNNSQYVYLSTTLGWKKFVFIGNYEQEPNDSSINDYSVYCDSTEKTFYYKESNGWELMPYPIYVFEEYSDEESEEV